MQEKAAELIDALAGLEENSKQTILALEAELSTIYLLRKASRNLVSQLLAYKERPNSETLAGIKAVCSNIMKTIVPSFAVTVKGKIENEKLREKLESEEEKIYDASVIAFHDLEALKGDKGSRFYENAKLNVKYVKDLAAHFEKLAREWSVLQKDKTKIILELIQTLNLIEETTVLGKAEADKTLILLIKNVEQLKNLLFEQKKLIEDFNSFFKEERTVSNSVKKLAEGKITLTGIKKLVATFTKPFEFQRFQSAILRHWKKFEEPKSKYKTPEEFLAKGGVFAAKAGEEKIRKAEERVAINAQLGILNKSTFEEFARKEIAVAGRNNSNLCVIMIDLDNFKLINDVYGHTTGDNVLKLVAGIIKDTIRMSDIFGRVGGEELAVVLPSTDEEGGFTLAERIRQKVSAGTRKIMRILNSEKGLKNGRENITISIGLSCFPDDGKTFETLYTKADKALYGAKTTGKNRVVACSFAKEETEAIS